MRRGIGHVNHKRIRWVLGLVLAAPASLAAADEDLPFLVADIHVGTNGSSPSYPVTYQGALFFSADGGPSGVELYRCTGPAGTVSLVKEIHAGGDASPQFPTVANQLLFFTADDGVHGRELWVTDGTGPGTVLVKDIRAGGGSSAPKDLTAFNGKLYFSADDGVHGRELWVSDGTESGTSLVVDLHPTLGSFAQNLTVYNGALYFSASTPGTGQELWKTDGSGAGTSLVKDIYPGGHSSPQSLTVANGLLFFSAADSVHGQELWVSNGTAGGTSLVLDIRPDGSAHPMFLTAGPEGLYFSADDGTHGRELWKTDGTAGGTMLVADIAPDGQSAFPQDLTVAGGGVYFTAATIETGRELFWSDGTAAGTALVKDIRIPGSSAPRHLHEANGLLYFQAADAAHGAELWLSNGTEGGTRLLHDIHPGVEYGKPSEFHQLGQYLYFAADDGVSGRELWAYRLPEQDTTPPVITILGSNPALTEEGAPYVDAGAVATDNADGDITDRITQSGLVNPAIPGTYSIVYSVSDLAGNSASETRIVEVLPAAPPAISLIGENPLVVEVHEAFTDPGATALDNVDGDISAQVAVTGTVDTSALGGYELIYTVSDKAGNAAVPVTRTVEVVDTTAPVIALHGPASLLVEQHTIYTDPGASASDNYDGDLTAALVMVNTVSTAIPSVYTVTYSVSDSSGNTAQAVRGVTVLPSEAPVITLLGDNPMSTPLGAPFVDPGATALDNVNGDVSALITTAGTVNTNAVGQYVITYMVSDAAGNAAVPAVRAVIVHAEGVAGGALDSDGDGILDAVEVELGFDPLDPNDAPYTWDFLHVFDQQGRALYGTHGMEWGEADVSGSRLPDRYEVALVAHGLGDRRFAFNETVQLLWLANLAQIRAEPKGGALAHCEHLLAALHVVGRDLSAAWKAKEGLGGVYAAFDPAGSKSGAEPFTGPGDLDGDLLTNHQEYVNVMKYNGGIVEFIAAATNPNFSGHPVPAGGRGAQAVAVLAMMAVGGGWIGRRYRPRS